MGQGRKGQPLIISSLFQRQDHNKQSFYLQGRQHWGGGGRGRERREGRERRREGREREGGKDKGGG